MDRVEMSRESGEEEEVQHPTVFISYIHESEEHCARVLKFAQVLRAEGGIDVNADFWMSSSRRDIGVWAEHSMYDVDYILAIASPRYRIVGNGYATDDENRGGTWEVKYLREQLQRCRTRWTERILPVLLPGHTPDEIPYFLQGYGAHHFRVTEISQEGIKKLVRFLTGQQEHTPPELGQPMVLPPKTGPGSPGWESRDRP